MADAPRPTSSEPVTFEALMAERQSFWGSFTSATTYATIGVVGLVILMAIFLT
jgi:hypothetical protein